MDAMQRLYVTMLAIIATLLLLILARLFPSNSLLPPPAPLHHLKIAISHSNPEISVHPPKHKIRNPSIPILTSHYFASGHDRSHPELCPSLGAKVRLLILVSSAPSNSAARDAIRKTWGHYAARSDISIAFVIGIPSETFRASIEAEDKLYGDIILGRFVDSYSNLSLKTLSMLEWVDVYCPKVRTMLKTNDYMFINLPKLLEFSLSQLNATKTMWGILNRNVIPKRTPSRRYVSKIQFPGKVYPPYLSGAAYMLTTDMIRDILAAAQNEPYLRLEDVFITGVLGSKIRIKRQHVPEFYVRAFKQGAYSCAVQIVIAVMAQFHEQFELWRKLFNSRKKCAASAGCSVNKDTTIICLRVWLDEQYLMQSSGIIFKIL